MQVGSAEKAGFDASRLARIDDVMQSFVSDNQLPGIITLVQRRGEIAQFGMYGAMDIASNTPMREDAIFRIYSMTKPIVSIGLMMLVEEGRLGLSDFVAEYIPAFRQTRVFSQMKNVGMQLIDQQQPMTVHHLMTHTAGLSYGFWYDHPVEDLYRQMLATYANRETPLSEFVKQVAGLPLLFQPGANWNYSVATDVIGHLIEVIADMPLADYLQERIFAPLGMVDTAFDVPENKLDRLASIYGSEKLFNPIHFKPAETPMVKDVSTPTQLPSGGAGLVSTLADYLTFANCLLNGGAIDGTRLVSPRTLQWMASDHLKPHMLPIKIGGEVGARFGLGFRVVKELGESVSMATSVGEYGWSGAANTFYSVAPTEDMVLLFMTQSMPTLPYPVRNRFVNMVYGAMID